MGTGVEELEPSAQAGVPQSRGESKSGWCGSHSSPHQESLALWLLRVALTPRQRAAGVSESRYSALDPDWRGEDHGPGPLLSLRSYRVLRGREGPGFAT